MSFKDVSIFSSGGHFVLQSKTIWAILVEDLISRNILIRNCFEFGQAIQELFFIEFFFFQSWDIKRGQSGPKSLT